MMVPQELNVVNFAGD